MPESPQDRDGAPAGAPRIGFAHVRGWAAMIVGAVSLLLCAGALVFGVAAPVGWSPLGLSAGDSLLVLAAVPALVALPCLNHWSLAAFISGAVAVAAWVVYATQAQLGLPVAMGWALAAWAYTGPPVTAALAVVAGRSRYLAEVRAQASPPA